MRKTFIRIFGVCVLVILPFVVIFFIPVYFWYNFISDRFKNFGLHLDNTQGWVQLICSSPISIIKHGEI